MDLFFKYITPAIYWLLVIIWSYIFVFYLKKINRKDENDKLLKLLLLILAIDAFRTLFESLYFGVWYTSLSGLLPIEIFNYLAQPQIVFFPKIFNIIAAILILMLLIKKWLPSEIKQKDKISLLIEDQLIELQETNKELKVAKEKAEESDRLKSAFLANMSHEIRTPMNGILGFAELLEEPDLREENKLEYVKIINNSGKRLFHIISEIIDISKIEACHVDIRKEKTNIKELLEETFHLFKKEAENKNLTFSFQNNILNENTIIETDKEKLFSIQTNLIKNAIKYTDKGSIEFGCNKKDDFLEFYVKDSGIGVKAERQAAIFERFIQADIEDVQARQGAGLGLSISKAYVEMLGGKIWIESTEGIGSTFYFNLPYRISEVKDTGAEKNNNPLKMENMAKNLKLLIAEDDTTSEIYMSILLEPIAKEIYYARTGKEAIEMMRNNPNIDFIFMDIQMPEMNGYQATHEIRKFNEEVIIIAQTAFALSGDKDKSMAAGCNDYISKPAKKDELLALIQKHVKN